MSKKRKQAEKRPSLPHFVGLAELPDGALEWLIARAIRGKKRLKKTGRVRAVLEGKTVAMIFQKPSLRTRLGFEVAMVQLGGHAICLDDHQTSIGSRESVEDAATVIASMCDGIVARVFDHALIESLAATSSVPVINALSDASHPCQAATDLMTLQERFGRLAGLRVAYVGDANNVARSLATACARVSASFVIASPSGYQFDASFVDDIRSRYGAEALVVADAPQQAAEGADALYTDVWASMGQEGEAAARREAFRDYQINTTLLERAKPEAVVMHCLPAHRGEEITDEVLASPRCVAFQQAENRLHFQRVLLAVLLGD